MFIKPKKPVEGFTKFQTEKKIIGTFFKKEYLSSLNIFADKTFKNLIVIGIQA